jgi:hypothetical protein
MNLQDFVKNVLVEINAAVDEARQITSRDIRFSEKDNARTVEFDVAVSAETADTKSGKAGIKVLQFAEAGGDISQENRNSTVSRITFGLRIESRTKQETASDRAALMRRNENARNNFP